MSALETPDSISVVIPTRNRPAMAVAAVWSVLAQTRPPLEVIVVVDGPESEGDTRAALGAIDEPTLRVIALPASLGGAEARNLGVRKAAGKWVAFLDDDDLWLPNKLETQLAFAAQLRSSGALVLSGPILSCPVLARGPGWEEVWPRQPYVPGSSMAEYLFCRRGWRYGGALLQTSTLMAPRELLLRLPFTPGLRKHQDWDWLLRVAADPFVSIQSVGEAPLAIFHVEGDRKSVGRIVDWRFSLEWALARRSLFSRRAFAGFLATECAAQAQHSGWRERAALFAELLRAGRPSPADLLRLIAFVTVPQTTRRRARDLLRACGVL